MQIFTTTTEHHPGPQFSTLLPLYEYENILSKVHLRDQTSSFLGQLLIRYMLQCNYIPGEIARDSIGRPFCPGFKGDFNISHHGSVPLI